MTFTPIETDEPECQWINMSNSYWVAFSIDVDGVFGLVDASSLVLAYIRETGCCRELFTGFPDEPGFYHASAKFVVKPGDGWEIEQDEYFELSGIEKIPDAIGAWPETSWSFPMIIALCFVFAGFMAVAYGMAQLINYPTAGWPLTVMSVASVTGLLAGLLLDFWIHP